ncbi:unnamed protein product, partial [Ceratitis capitata]
MLCMHTSSEHPYGCALVQTTALSPPPNARRPTPTVRRRKWQLKENGIINELQHEPTQSELYPKSEPRPYRSCSESQQTTRVKRRKELPE